MGDTLTAERTSARLTAGLQTRLTVWLRARAETISEAVGCNLSELTRASLVYFLSERAQLPTPELRSLVFHLLACEFAGQEQHGAGITDAGSD